jgi:Ca-activated chloride channel homolog
MGPHDAGNGGARFGSPAAILVTVALLLVACGGQQAPPMATASPTTSTAAPATTTAAPTAGTGGPSVTAPSEVEAGAEFEVTWGGPDGEGDFVSLVAPGVETWTNERYFYTRSGPTGKLVAPVADGPYELVYFTGVDREALARVPITVTPFVGSVSAPDSVAGGTDFDVSWTGPDGPGDYISILPDGATAWTNETYFYTRTGSTGTLVAPVEEGDYEIWYITGTERALMVSVPITVTPLEISLTAPLTVQRGSEFEVSWTGPDAPSDYITILPAGATAWTNESYFYTRTGPSGTLTAPDAPGAYEIWYIFGGSRELLESVPITVN